MSENPPLSRPHGPRPAANVQFASLLAGLKSRGGAVRAWAAPGEPVLLMHPDGTQSTWRAGMRLPGGVGAKRPKFVAVQIPEDLVLRRGLVLPRMSDAHGTEAVLLEVRSNSPFPPQDLTWGCVVRELAGGQKQVELALASRRHVAEFVADRWPELAAGATRPEVWAASGDDVPIVLQGFGEIHRLHDASLQRRWNWALAGVALALAVLAAGTPTMQLRLRALEAVAAFETVLRRVSPLVRKRDELAALNDRIRSLDQIASERVDPAGVMEYLTQVLPDDTYLYSLDLQKGKITASGHTVDASALLQKLSSDPRLKNVKAPMAVTRQPGAAKEVFVIEFTMEPKPATAATAGVTPAAGPAVAAGAGAAPVVAAAASGAALPGAAPAPLPKPAGASPFVIGGSR